MYWFYEYANTSDVSKTVHNLHMTPPKSPKSELEPIVIMGDTNDDQHTGGTGDDSYIKLSKASILLVQHGFRRDLGQWEASFGNL